MKQIVKIVHPDRTWVEAELEKLYRQWLAWQEKVGAIVDQPYNANTHSEVFADGKDMMRNHEVLQAKTLTFLDANIEGHNFVRGFEGKHVDRTDLRLRIRVDHRIEELEILRACLEYSASAVPDKAPLSTEGARVAPSDSSGERFIKVFVSHSSIDKPIAEAFIELLRASLPIAAKDIRCTSVAGYKLPAGTNSDEQLRREVFESRAFVALLSPVSVASMYVMFELGARWGTKRLLAPVMVGGLTPAALKAPLSALHAVTGTSAADLHQLIQDLAETLQLPTEKPQAYERALGKLIAAAKDPSDGNS